MVAIISLVIAMVCMVYAIHLHIFYHHRLVSRKEAEEYKFREAMRKLDIKEPDISLALKEYWHISDLIAANKKLKKAIKKHKLL